MSGSSFVLDWMVWTLPVAVFFACIVLLLAGMTIWEIKSPTSAAQGFLPIATTRGDRLFIGLLAAAYVNLAFVGVERKDRQLVRVRAGALRLDRLRRVDGSAGAGAAQGVTRHVWPTFPGPDDT